MDFKFLYWLFKIYIPNFEEIYGRICLKNKNWDILGIQNINLAVFLLEKEIWLEL